MLSKKIAAIVILVLTIIFCFAFPKVKYQSPDMLSKLVIPTDPSVGWHSKDISDQFDTKDLKYNFISRIFARIYTNPTNQSILLMILDAGNFHNPKVCYGSSGYQITDMPDITLRAGNRSFNAQSVFMEKDSQGLLIIYWICIDKKMVNWTGQKLMQLVYSMFNKEKIGFMIRLDVPTTLANAPNAQKFAQEFIDTIYSQIPSDQVEYIFGKQL